MSEALALLDRSLPKNPHLRSSKSVTAGSCDSEALRREIQSLSVIENWNGQQLHPLQRLLTTTWRQKLTMLALHLLQIRLV
jgi:hypothetical protein